MDEMIEIDGAVVARQYIITARIDTRQYVNGSETFLVVHLSNGHTIRVSSGKIDIYALLDNIKKGG
jgi:hypothetical protein